MRAARLALALLVAAPTPAVIPPTRAAAQAPPTPAGVVTTLQGQAVVARAAAPAAVALRFKDPVFVRDRIETRQDSVVRVLLGGKVLVTVRELSVFTITEEPGRARIDLADGKVAVGVAKSLLRPGEAIEIRTPNAVAAVRGSEIVAEVAVTGGVPQSTITALDVSLPVTVTPLGAPGAGVTLGVNQAVSILGLAGALTISPVRTLTSVQVQAAARAAQAPKPREQSDRPPEQIARKVSEDKTREAVQLSEAVTGGDTASVTGSAVSSTVSAELTAADETYRQTQDVLDLTSQRLDEIFEATAALIERAFASERLAPGFVIEDQALAFGADGGLVFDGTQSLAFNPIGGIFNSQITQSGPGDLLATAAGSSIAFEGSLIFIGDRSVVATEGSLFSVGADATLTSGFGGSSIVAIGSGAEGSGPATVLTGRSLVAIGPRAQVTLERSLLFLGAGTTVVAGSAGEASASLVEIGGGARVRAVQALDVASIAGSVAATGSVLSLGPDASLEITTEAGGLAALGFSREGKTGIEGANVVTGDELVVLRPRARLTTTQPLVAAFGAELTIGVGAVPKDFIGVEEDARLVTSATDLITIGRFIPDESDTVTRSRIQVGRHLLSLGARAAVVSESDLAVPFIDVQLSDVAMQGDAVSLRGGAELRLGPQDLLVASESTLVAGGSLLALDKDAVFTLAGTLDLPVFVFLSSSIAIGADLATLAPEAAWTFQRPLIISADSAVSARRLLALGAGASVAVPDLTTLALLLFSGGAVSLGADAVWLGAGSRLELNRPLIQARNASAVETGGSVLTLEPDASLASGGASGQFALLEFTDSAVRAGGAAAVVGAGARLALDRPLLGSFDSNLTLPAGALRVQPGGQVSATATPEFFVGLGRGTHAIGTAPGASVFDLAGLATGFDAESQLTLGTDRPVQYPGALLIAADAALTTGRVARLDTALLEATAPLLDLRRSTATVSADVMDLTLRAKLSGVGPLASLDGSTLSVLAGAFANVAGGSFLKVLGDLLELRNGSTLNLFNGPVLSVSGGSAVNISGALVAFNGTGGNAVNIANALCPCTLLGGVPVALRDGATASNVSIGGGAIRNPGLGTVSFSSPSAAAIVVSGPASRVTIGGVPQ